MPGPRARPGAIDDPVVDWGPDAGQGLFDPVESSGSGEVTGRQRAQREDGREVTKGREITASPARERPMAVLAWIGATLTVGAGTSGRGPAPGLAELIAEEPPEVLPGSFFPKRTEPTRPAPEPAAAAVRDVTPADVAEEAEIAPPRLAVRHRPRESSGWGTRVVAIVLWGALIALALSRVWR